MEIKTHLQLVENIISRHWMVREIQKQIVNMKKKLLKNLWIHTKTNKMSMKRK